MISHQAPLTHIDPMLEAEEVGDLAFGTLA